MAGTGSSLDDQLATVRSMCRSLRPALTCASDQVLAWRPSRRRRRRRRTPATTSPELGVHGGHHRRRGLPRRLLRWRRSSTPCRWGCLALELRIDHVCLVAGVDVDVVSGRRPAGTEPQPGAHPLELRSVELVVLGEHEEPPGSEPVVERPGLLESVGVQLERGVLADRRVAVLLDRDAERHDGLANLDDRVGCVQLAYNGSLGSSISAASPPSSSASSTCQAPSASSAPITSRSTSAGETGASVCFDPISSSTRMSLPIPSTSKRAVPMTCQRFGPSTDAVSFTPSRSTPAAVMLTSNSTEVRIRNGENSIRASKPHEP